VDRELPVLAEDLELPGCERELDVDDGVEDCVERELQALEELRELPTDCDDDARLRSED
jgi:hypothetical protein